MAKVQTTTSIFATAKSEYDAALAAFTAEIKKEPQTYLYDGEFEWGGVFF